MGDYKHFVSMDSARSLGAGAVGALGVHAGDLTLRDGLQDANGPTKDLAGGQLYGGLALQVPLAIAWWAIGAAAGSARDAETGRDLLRAQISATSWTYAFKFAVNRT